jgi:hypothetical protein
VRIACRTSIAHADVLVSDLHTSISSEHGGSSTFIWY